MKKTIGEINSPNMEFGVLPSDGRVSRTIRSLEANNIRTVFVQNGREAKLKVMALVPPGSEVFTATSRTLDQIGVADEINKSGHYVSLRSKISTLDRRTQGNRIRLVAAMPEYVIGSVHAVTEQGEVIVVSASGGQLSLYSSGAGTVIWVAGVQKLVKDLEEGFRRIYEYAYPLENARMKELHKLPSAVNKMLIVNREGKPGRTTMILVNENLGF